MKTDDWKNALRKLGKFKYPLLVLLIGVILMLLPTGKPAEKNRVEAPDMAQLLSSAEGVGEAKVLTSENGVVVVCRGADSARVRLDILNAVSSYTGFSSDRITILKMRK